MATFDFDCFLKIRKRFSTRQICCVDDDFKQFSIKRSFETSLWLTQFNTILAPFGTFASLQKIKIILFDKEEDKNIFECTRCYGGYDRYQIDVGDIYNWLMEQNFHEGEHIKMHVEENNIVARYFKFRCALVRGRTQEGKIVHDGFRRLAIDSNGLSGIEGKIKNIFPQIDAPAHFIFIDRGGKENTFLSTDVGRFGGYSLGNWLAKHFPVEDDGIKLFIDLPLVSVATKMTMTPNDILKNENLFKGIESSILEKLSHLFLSNVIKPFTVASETLSSNNLTGQLLDNNLVLDKPNKVTALHGFDDDEFEVIESIKEGGSSPSNCEQVRLNDTRQASILKFIEMNV